MMFKLDVLHLFWNHHQSLNIRIIMKIVKNGYSGVLKTKLDDF